MTDDQPRFLDMDSLADLANLPLPEDERQALQRDCEKVLEAFQLPDLEDTGSEEEGQVMFPDEAEPWPEDGVEKILDQAPRVEGRLFEG